MTRPDWLVPGAEVAEFSPRRQTHGGHIETTTIARVLARDVVLANGHRYNADRLSKSNGSTWDPPTVLLPADDPKIARAREANRLSRTASVAIAEAEKLTRAISEYRYGKGGIGAVEQRLAALTSAVEVIKRCRP